MSVSIENIRVNSFNPFSVDIYSGLNPIFSWDFVNDVLNVPQAGFVLRVGTSNDNWGYSSFNGDKLNIENDSTISYYEYDKHNLERGRQYYAQVRAWDYEYTQSGGDSFISDWYTFSFSINSLPYITLATILPASPTTADNLTIVYNYNDDDGHEEGNTSIRWYNHNILQDEFNDLLEIESKYLSVGDSFSAKISPFDGFEYGATYSTQSVTISGADVNISNIQILPTDANTDDFLKIDYTIVDDPYLDLSNTTVSFEWYVNGTQISAVTQIVRTELSPGDQVYGKVIIKDNDNTVAEGTSSVITISDTQWHLFDLKVEDLSEPIGLTELNPILTWKKYKSNEAANESPDYLRVLVTKTASRSSAIYDSGTIAYTKDSYLLENVLSRGTQYYIHVAVSDTTTFTNYIRKNVVTSGSSWYENVNNVTGWTVEFRARLNSNIVGEKQGIQIHDGSYFCSLTFSNEEVDDAGQTKSAARISFLSGNTHVYNLIDPEPLESFYNFQTYRITCMGQNVKVYLNNKEVLNLENALSTVSLLKQLEFGDFNASKIIEGTWKFFRYSTNGPYDIGESFLEDSDQFDFYSVSQLKNGSIDHMIAEAIPVPESNQSDFPSSFLVSWTPDSGSGKIVSFNENGEELTLPVATKNYAPITSIKIDNNRNKYIGSSKGVTVFYGSKHDSDYEFNTDGTFSLKPDFDIITDLPASALPYVQPTSSGSIDIDTTHNVLGVATNPDWNGEGDFDPYYYQSTTGIYYLSQRTQGQSWFDNVDNEKGWQVEFTMNIGLIEQDSADDENLNKQGVGFYVNDGVRQEIINFNKNSITLTYANITASLNTGYNRIYRITGKGNNIKVYQRYASTSMGTEQLLLDGTGLFTTEATTTANSRKPRIALDPESNHHAVWQDDGKKVSSIYYSKFDGSSWSHPEIVNQSVPFSLKNPDIVSDNAGNLFVVYEDLSYGKSEISVSIKDSAGWNPKLRLTNYNSRKTCPRVTADHLNNIHVVWQDDRNGPPQVFWCYRDKEKEAWVSSGQFGEDENIVSQNNSDPNMGTNSLSFKNPSICYVFPKIFIAFEGDNNNGTSNIFVSYYDVLEKNWYSSGYPQILSSGATSPGTSVLVSSTGRTCVYPDISGAYNQIGVVWEDQTEPYSQIWGTSLFTETVSVFSPVTKITNRLADCKNPSIGFINSVGNAIILFESNEFVAESTGAPATIIATDGGEEVSGDTSKIFAVKYNSAAGVFEGSNTNYTDDLVFTESSFLAHHPHLPKVVPTESFKSVYDYYKQLDENATISDEEKTKFWLIGDADLYAEISTLSTTVDTRGTDTLSSPYTREFAFGDIDEAIGVQMSVKNISMYFGYDARPLVILNINSDTVSNWPDDRVYDVFVDAYGNILAATHSGLVYYRISTGSMELVKLDPDNPDETDFVVNAIEFSKNGVWFVGTKNFSVYSLDGGKTWSKIKSGGSDITNVRSLTVDQNGSGVFGTANGIYVVPINFENQQNDEPVYITNITNTTNDVKVVKVDESNIIWAGTDAGIIRIENHVNKTVANTANGMRSSYVTDISIVSKGIRYVATATGIEKMTGFTFEPINVLNTDIDSDNVLSLNYFEATNSLWLSSNNLLYELIFRDPKTEITPNELVKYDSEIPMSELRDSTTHYILGLDTIVGGNSGEFSLDLESTSVLINKNPIDFGYSIDNISQAIVFDVDPLDGDQVEIVLSNFFKTFKDLTQTSIEQEILGEIDTSVLKMVKTPSNQLMTLTGLENHSVSAYMGLSNLPFTTIILDREKPIGCLEALEQIDRTNYKFKITASDQISGVTSMKISNYENFTTDGETAQEWEDYERYSVHNIGEQLNNVTVDFVFPDTVTIDSVVYNVGSGKLLASLTPVGQISYVYAITSKPVIVFRYDSTLEEWEAISALNNGNAELEVHSALTVNETLFITTGSTNGPGSVYTTVDGRRFSHLGSCGNNILCSVATGDGIVFFGNDQGEIYEYLMDSTLTGNPFQRRFNGIGQRITKMEYANNFLYVVTQNTGTEGSGFQINLSNNDISSFFPQSSTYLSDIKLVDQDMFVVDHNSKELWRSPYSVNTQLTFVKSYSATALSSMDLYEIPTIVLTEEFETVSTA